MVPLKSFNASYRGALAAAMLLALPAPGSALTLAEAVNQAMARRPQAEIQTALAEVGASYQRQAGQWLGGVPQAALGYQSDRPASDQGLRETEVYVELPLWLPGQRQARRALGERIQEQATSGTRRLRWEVSEQVRERAWNLRLAQAETQLATRQLAAGREFEQAIRRRTQAGELARIDLLLAQQETLQLETHRQEALGRQLDQEAAWTAYTGLSELPEDLELESLAAGELDASHPLLAAASDRVARERAQRDDTRVSRPDNPLLTVGARRSRGTVQDDFVDSLGAEIKLPFGGKAYRAPELAQAETSLTEALATYAETEHDLELSIEQQRIALDQAEAALRLTEQRNELAQQGLRLAERAFELGEGELRVLLLARKEAAVSTVELERRRLERLRAVARYNQALGVIPQ